MCRHDHGLSGQLQGCIGAAGGEGWHCWQLDHCPTIFSISFGHYTRPPASDTPRCPPWSSTNTLSRPGGGI